MTQANKNLWSQMSLLDKATFIAQVSAPLALLVTVLFSWLSFSEARRSAQIQERIFMAQNAPALKLVRLELSEDDSGREIVLFAKNDGGSAAYNVCLDSFLGEDLRGVPIGGTCKEGTNNMVDLASERYAGSIEITKSASDFDEKYQDYKLSEYGDTLYIERSIHVQLTYQDTFNNTHTVSTNIYGLPK